MFLQTQSLYVDTCASGSEIESFFQPLIFLPKRQTLPLIFLPVTAVVLGVLSLLFKNMYRLAPKGAFPAGINTVTA